MIRFQMKNQTTPFYNGGLREQDDNENVSTIIVSKDQFQNGKGGSIRVGPPFF